MDVLIKCFSDVYGQLLRKWLTSWLVNYQINRKFDAESVF